MQKSKGEPAAILKVAQEFREYSKPMRDALEELAYKEDGNTPESRSYIQQEIRELGNQLRRNIKIENSPKLSDAIEVRFVLGIPIPFVSGKELLKWIHERYQRRRTAVLTELVRASAFSENSEHLFKRLWKRSARFT